MARYRIATTGKNFASDGPIAVQDGWAYFNVALASGGFWAVGVPIAQVLSVVDTDPQKPIVVEQESDGLPAADDLEDILEEVE
jgi:hypothetical protein